MVQRDQQAPPAQASCAAVFVGFRGYGLRVRDCEANSIAVFILRSKRERLVLQIIIECPPVPALLGPLFQRASRSVSVLAVAALFLYAVVAVGLCACHASDKLPRKSSKEYAQAVSAFYIGLGALQVGDDVHAESKLSEIVTLVPGEPAGWANWGVLALRQRRLDIAGQRIERARSLAPNNDHIYQLLGYLESSKGNSANAINDWRKAVEINPGNYRAAYQLAEEVERQGGPNSDAEYQRLITKIMAAQPDNLAAQLELTRVAAKTGDTATLKSSLARISSRSSNWPPEVKQQLAALQAAADGPNPRAAAARTTFLRNTLMRVPEFRESLAILKALPGEEAEPFTHFLLLEPPDFTPAPRRHGAGLHLEDAARRRSSSVKLDWCHRVGQRGCSGHRPSQWQGSAFVFGCKISFSRRTIRHRTVSRRYPAD